MIYKNIKTITSFICIFAMIVSCDKIDPNVNYGPNVSYTNSNYQQQNPTPESVGYFGENVVKEDFIPIYNKKFIKTQEKALKFDLELPQRCNVNWDSQNLIQTQTVPEEAFYLERVNKGDKLPNFNLEGISFKDESIVKIISSLLKGTGVKLMTNDDIFEKITITSLEGSLENVIDFIAKSANFYYTYDERRKILILSKDAKWNIHVPFVKEVVLSVEDALYGAGIETVTIDWADKVLITQGNFITEKTIRKTLSLLKRADNLIAYDIDVYRVYTKNNQEIAWENLITSLRADTVKVSVMGVLGRAISASSNLDKNSLNDFLLPEAAPVLVSRGKFVIPDRWQGRFDIGRCSREVRLETDLFLMAEAKFQEREKKRDKIDLKLVLRTSKGDVTSFELPTRIGENVLLFGIPTHYFLKTPETIIAPNTELVVLISPRIIKMMKKNRGANHYEITMPEKTDDKKEKKEAKSDKKDDIKTKLEKPDGIDGKIKEQK